jgi:hypothetical protein
LQEENAITEAKD